MPCVAVAIHWFGSRCDHTSWRRHGVLAEGLDNRGGGLEASARELQHVGCADAVVALASQCAAIVGCSAE